VKLKTDLSARVYMGGNGFKIQIYDRYSISFPELSSPKLDRNGVSCLNESTWQVLKGQSA
jgi:hypothetical protein